MKEYFEKKIGEKITKTLCTGRECFTEVYKRQYFIEIISVKNNNLLVIVSSQDLTPSGYRISNSDIYHGEYRINIAKFTSFEKLIKEIITIADTSFILKYPNAI